MGLFSWFEFSFGYTPGYKNVKAGYRHNFAFIGTGVFSADDPSNELTTNTSKMPGYRHEKISDETHEYVLQKNEEFRFEVDFETKVEIQLTSGTAEIFGTEIITEQPYAFVGTKAAIFTYHGATLSVRGTPAVAYVAGETPTLSYANLHFTLEKIRQHAEDSQSKGPRVLLLGSEDAGKTSLAKILVGYSVRQGRNPVLVGLDPKDSILSVPGTLTAACIQSTLDVEEGYGSSTIHGHSQIPTKTPLVYYFGHQSPVENLKLYKKYISRLALAVTSRLDEDAEENISGCIIDTSGVLDQSIGTEIIRDIVAEFAVTVIVVLGHERLYNDMVRRYSNKSGVAVVKLARSGGAVELNDAYVQQLQNYRTKQYFYGELKNILSPVSRTLDFKNIKVYRLAEGNAATHASALPIGQEESAIAPEIELVQLESPAVLQHSILSITSVGIDEDPRGVLESNVLGFIFVSDVDDVKQKLTVLQPMKGNITNILIMGTFKWQDT